jgi:glycosyltransferase involved in cell wall biosynthesis
MKIAFLHHSFMLGQGTDSLVYFYAHKLQGLGHKVTIFTSSWSYPTGQPIGGLTLRILKPILGNSRLGSSLSFPILTFKLKSELNSYDIIITQLYPMCIIPLLHKDRKYKWVHIEWGTPGTSMYSKVTEKFYYKFVKQIHRLACRKADETIVSSEFLGEWVTRNYKIVPKLVYIDGVDFEALDVDKVGLADNKFLEKPNDILYVGRISPHKNIEALVVALKAIKEFIPDVTLTLVGNYKGFPSYTRKLKEMALDYHLSDRINWVGQVPWGSLKTYYQGCKVYCSPSLWEGFMRCEAYAFKKPMVGFNTTSNPETLSHGGEIAMKASPWALTKLITTLLKTPDLAKLEGNIGYTWAKETQDLNIQVKNLERELLEVYLEGEE